MLGEIDCCTHYTYRCAHPQPPPAIFAGMGKPLHHVDVFDRNQAGQSVCFVNQQKFPHLFSS